ncbi:MAG: heparinase II/III family protein [Erysipelotrichaceae bacterium]
MKLYFNENQNEIEQMKELFLKDIDYKRVLKRANQLCEHIFVFDDIWDMEGCDTPYKLDKINWNDSSNDDEEWCFMLNRFDYAHHLIKAYVATSDILYVNTWKELVFDWIEHHQIIEKENSTRTLDTAIRCVNFIQGIKYLETFQCLNQREYSIIIHSVLLQLQYLKEKYIPKYTLSNWGSIQTCAILYCLKQMDQYYENYELNLWATKECETQLKLQIMDDGNLWEQSTMYHVQVLNSFMLVADHQCFKDEHLNHLLLSKIKLMGYALLYQMNPQGCIESYGDSDRSNVLGVLSHSALLLQDGVLKKYGYQNLDMHLVYQLGICAYQSYEKINPIETTSFVYHGEDSGMVCIHSSFHEQSSYTFFTNGGLGSGHGHSDNLHYSLYCEGKAFLIDSGRFTYCENQKRLYLKSNAAHNSIVIDLDPTCTPSDSWGYTKFLYPLKNYVRVIENTTYIEGAILGESNNLPYTQVRKILVINPDIWVIVDMIIMEGYHEMVSYHHFDPDVMIKYQHGYVIGIENDGVCMQVTHEGIDDCLIESKMCSLHYNQERNHFVTKTIKKFKDKGLKCDIIINENKVKALKDVLIYQDGNLKPVHKDIVMAKEFVISSNESYLVIIFHQEIYEGRKLFFYKDIPLSGKCIVYHQQNGIYQIIYLKK